MDDAAELPRITREALERLTYQKYGDSPTIRSYTKWKLFEENSPPLKLPTEAKAGEVPVKGHVTFSGSEASFDLPNGVELTEGTLGLSQPEESRILASTSTPSKRHTGSGLGGETSRSRS